MANGQDKFTWEMQLAGYSHQKVDKMGETDYEKFLNEFERFPWIEQIEKANEYSDKVSPTLFANDMKTGKIFWISMSGDKDHHGYVIGYIYLKEKKSFLGLRPSKMIRWLEIYLTGNKKTVTDLIRLFFERDYTSFENSIRKLDQVGQMEVAEHTD